MAIRDSSKSISLGSMLFSSFQSKQLTREPSIRCNILTASRDPGQILLPLPKGVSLKCRPLKSMSESKNLSGENTSASSHTSGLLPMVHSFISTWAPCGIVNPHTSTSVFALRGSRTGAGGCMRRLSFITTCRYGSLAMSASSTAFPTPITWANSFFTFRITSGLCISSVIVRSKP